MCSDDGFGSREPPLPLSMPRQCCRNVLLKQEGYQTTHCASITMSLSQGCPTLCFSDGKRRIRERLVGHAFSSLETMRWPLREKPQDSTTPAWPSSTNRRFPVRTSHTIRLRSALAEHTCHNQEIWAFQASMLGLGQKKLATNLQFAYYYFKHLDTYANSRWLVILPPHLVVGPRGRWI